MSALITTDLVALDADLGPDKDSVVRRLAALVAGAGRATGAEALHDDAMAREAKAATGLPGGIAIPHCRSGAVTEASLAFARLDPKVDFGAPDGPADLAFLIAAPEHGDADHLTLLTALARALVRPEFVASLRGAGSDQEVVRLVEEVVSPAPATASAAENTISPFAAPGDAPTPRASSVNLNEGSNCSCSSGSSSAALNVISASSTLSSPSSTASHAKRTDAAGGRLALRVCRKNSRPSSTVNSTSCMLR